MVEVEFQAKVQNGIIIVPEQYQSDLAEVEHVRVTLCKLTSPPFFEDEFILQLLQNPVSVPGIRPITRQEMHER